MFRGDKFAGVVSLGCVFVVCTLLTSSDGRRREFFKPPSSCLTGPSCELCEETVTFFHQQVCCYQCRLDNVVINNHLCHCINTRLVDPPRITGKKVRGNCSRGRVCDNCAVKMSADGSLMAEATPGTLQLCCPDCGIVIPFFHQDETGCHCAGDSQGRVHEVAPRYDPSKHPSTTPPPLPLTASLAARLRPMSWHLLCVYILVLVSFSFVLILRADQFCGLALSS